MFVRALTSEDTLRQPAAPYSDLSHVRPIELSAYRLVLIFLALGIHSNEQSRCGIVQSAITKWPLRASTELAGHTPSGDWPVCSLD
jgi:hypothetical protein